MYARNWLDHSANVFQGSLLGSWWTLPERILPFGPGGSGGRPIRVSTLYTPMAVSNRIVYATGDMMPSVELLIGIHSRLGFYTKLWALWYTFDQGR